MLKIRLTRVGKKNQPHYKIIIAKARSKRNGKHIEIIGSYNPLTEPATFKINKDRLNYWLAKGAQPTDTVRKLAAKI